MRPAGKLEIKPLSSEDAVNLVRVHREAFDARIVEYTIFSCHGVWRYFRSLLALPELQRENAFVGAWAGTDLVGYVHGRNADAAWRLNNIAVVPRAQGLGIGCLLYEAWYQEGIGRGLRRATLNTYEKGGVAWDWYMRLGFTPVSESSVILQHSAQPARDVGDHKIVGWDTAEAWHSTFGFSHFELEMGDKTWWVGRLGDRFFRITSDLPASARAVLGRVDQTRSLLVRSPSNSIEHAGRTILTECRMERSLQEA